MLKVVPLVTESLTLRSRLEAKIRSASSYLADDINDQEIMELVDEFEEFIIEEKHRV